VNCIGGVGLARARRPFPKLPELQDEVTAAVVMDTRQWVGLAVILSRLTDYKNPLQSLNLPGSLLLHQQQSSTIESSSPNHIIKYAPHKPFSAITNYLAISLDSSPIIFVYQSANARYASLMSAVCRSNHVTYTCPLDKCKVDNKDWASATFTKCDLLDKPRGNVIPGRQKESIVPMQYHVQNTGVEVQNQGDRFWYRCVSTVTDRSNDHRASESLSASNGASHHLLMHLFKFISVYSMSKSIKL
ncbi:hypothetical protein MJO28_005623, partial [Puccinia striiformis f. sp. tritici]